MKAYRLSLAIALALVASAVFVVIPDPAFAADLSDHLVGGLGSHLVEATVALAALRSKHADLTVRIAAKAAEIQDGMPDAEVRRIEGEHEALVTEAADVQRQIAEAETEERTRAPAGPDQEAVRAATAAAIAAERTRVAETRISGRPTCCARVTSPSCSRWVRPARSSPVPSARARSS
jgi:capsule polysaccharide export protein KpsE/RkpR